MISIMSITAPSPDHTIQSRTTYMRLWLMATSIVFTLAIYSPNLHAMLLAEKPKTLKEMGLEELENLAVLKDKPLTAAEACEEIGNRYIKDRSDASHREKALMYFDRARALKRGAREASLLTPKIVTLAKLLSVAAKRGTRAQLAQLLDTHTIDVQAQYKKGKTLLHYASAAGNTDTVELLLERATSVDTPNAAGRTALHRAVKADHGEVTAMLLDAKANPRVIDRSFMTPAHYAALNDNIELLCLLVEAGADLTARLGGVTPLRIFGIKASPEQLALYKESGCSLHALDCDGSTLLHLAAWGHCLESILFLLENNLDVNALDATGNTPLFRALASEGLLKQANEHLIPRKIALYHELKRSEEGGPSVLTLKQFYRKLDLLWANISPYLRQTFFDYEQNRTKEIVRSLLKAGATLTTSAHAKTALHIACMYGSPETITILIGAGADVNSCTADGSTPLHIAATYGRLASAATLLKHGADIHAICTQTERTAQKRMSALAIAAQEGFGELCELFIQHGVRDDDPGLEEAKRLIEKLKVKNELKIKRKPRPIFIPTQLKDEEGDREEIVRPHNPFKSDDKL